VAATRFGALGAVLLLGFLAAAEAESPQQMQGLQELRELASLRDELSSLRAEMSAQRTLIEAQQAELSQAAASRQLAASSWVLQKDLDAAVKDLTEANASQNGAMDSVWLLLCGTLVMFMHAGFAMLETGCCRAKNASNVLMKNLINVCVGTLGWWLLGYGFAYGELSGKFIGSSGFANNGFLVSGKDETLSGLPAKSSDGVQSPMLSWFFQWAFCTAAATIVSGGVAERVKSPSFGLYAFFMTSFIYPVVVAWTWNYGWLSDLLDVGYMDFAGSGIVHLTGGVSALMGTIVLGPRKGRFERPEDFEAHNLPLVVLGTFALWFGWYGFNPGSTLGLHTKEKGALAAQVAMNTTLSAATGGLVVFTIRYALMRKYDVGGLCNGILAGLVSITAGCGNMESGSAFATGLIGGFVYQGASMTLVALKIDDPVDASPVHGACGIWGVLAAALFDWGSGFDHFHGWSGFSCMTDSSGACRSGIGGKVVGVQIIMVIAIVAWSATFSGLSFLALKLTGLLRIDDETEEQGIDQRQHSPPKAYSLEASGAKL
jgi:Amt family ammonium transporter